MALQLDRLVEQELILLRLLAQGHTAKTIAASEGLSVNVINERLRAARRKTEAVSSRQLARLINEREQPTSQKSRDKFFGIEDPSRHGSNPMASATGAGLKAIWRSAMTIGILVTAGIAAYLSAVPDSPAGALTRLRTTGDALYIVEGSVVRGEALTLATLVMPLGEYGLMSMRIQMDCQAERWQPTAISFYNQDGTPRRSADMGGNSGWSTRNVEAIAEKVCA